MRYKHIMCFFWVSTAACAVIRTLQLLFTVEGTTGFIKKEYRSLGIGMMAIICLAAAVCIVIGASVRRCPLKMPKVSYALGIGAMALGAVVLYDVFFLHFSSNVPLWQVIVVEAFGCFSGIFFIAYGLKAFVKYRMPSVLFAVPTIYWAAKLISVFTSISSLTMITDNILMCATYCATLVFVLELAKLANGINVERTSRVLMASGLCAANLSVVSSLPRFTVALSGHSDLLHESVSSALTTLVTGIFIILFIIHYFRNKNLARHHRHHSRHSGRYMPDNGEQYDFYTGSERRSSENR